MAKNLIDAGICERLITAATSRCAAPTSPQLSAPQIVKEPNWEGVTTSLTALSTAIGWGLLVVAITTLLGLIAWVYFVRQWARDEARKAAQEWLNTDGVATLRSASSLLNPNGGDLPPNAAQQSADDIGEAAG
jgi:hypothetical protein